jgi:superfamily II DNA/RNA helicase
MDFTSFKLSSPIVKAIAEIGYSKATPVQCRAIPVILSGKDMIAVAQTGTGKTASFVLPLLEQIHHRYKKDNKVLRAKRIRALILVPTRELAKQIKQSIDQLGKYLNINCMAMYGGVDAQEQKQQLIKAYIDYRSCYHVLSLDQQGKLVEREQFLQDITNVTAIWKAVFDL